MNSPTATVRYTSFDGGVTLETRCRQPDRYGYWDTRSADELTISRGAGLSYTAASFSGAAVTVDHTRFNRLLAFDPLENTLEVEAGIRLGDIYEFLTPRGLFLAVQPGHPNITVGGCVAADVHGKNQFRDGTFLSQVRSLKLFHPTHGVLELSRLEQPELFALTCGGYGLTGNILSVTLAVTPIPASLVRLRITPLANAWELPTALSEAAACADLVYSWHNFTVTGATFGHGFVVAGTFVSDAPAANGPAGQRRQKRRSRLSAEARGSWRWPFFNSISTPLFNRTYHAAMRFARREKVIPLFDFIFPVHDKEAYFKLFGRAGFLEYQMIISADRYAAFIERIRSRLAQRPLPITLASAKLFQGKQDLLRFTGDGICLALNFPRSAESIAFADFLDGLLPEFGVRPNLIKDSRLPAAVVAATYPEYELYRDRLRSFDPRRLCRSELSERLGL